MSKREYISIADARPPFYIGVDLGGTNTKIGLVDDCGHPVSWGETPTCSNAGPEDVVERISDAIHKLISNAGLKPSEIARVGLGAPGILDFAAGKMVNPTNFPGWNGFPIRDALAKQSGLPVSFVNDASAAAYGEFWVGSGRLFHSMVMLTLGTGVGCGIIVGDLIIEGENGHGTECGHILIDSSENARKCSCGQLGHLEAYASATAVIQRTKDILKTNEPTTLRKRVRAGEEVTPLLVAQEAEKGDAVAMRIVMDTARYVALGLISLMHTIDPSGILIGGSMTFQLENSTLGEQFIQRIREEVCCRTFPTLAENTVIEFASLGSDAGYLGAAGIARLEFQRRKGPSATRQAMRKSRELVGM